MSKIISFIKNWTLPIAIALGIAAYYIYTAIPFFDNTHAFVANAIAVIQPVLIFAMLFLTFCKIKLSELRLKKWHLWLLLIQSVTYMAGIIVCTEIDSIVHKILIESFILCMICPTATAAAVITSKLGGNPATLTAYTILINLVVAIIVPIFTPLLHPVAGQTFMNSFWLIICKVFPMLFLPFLLAITLRRISKNITEWFASFHNLAFYLWAVALSLAIGVTVKAIVHTHSSLTLMLLIAILSAMACVIQFSLGHIIGVRYKDTISATQSLGQKNTVFAIWMGYTFMSPVTSIAGGFYSVWHNIFNSWQLYQKQHSKTAKSTTKT